MKLGITPWDFTDRSAAGLSAQATRAEAIGYESFWLPESHFGTNAIPEPLMLLAAVLYVILPADLIPDVIPVAGWLDDLGLLALVSGWLATAYSRYRKRPEADADAARREGDPWAPPDR